MCKDSAKSFPFGNPPTRVWKAGPSNSLLLMLCPLLPPPPKIYEAYIVCKLQRIHLFVFIRLLYLSVIEIICVTWSTVACWHVGCHLHFSFQVLSSSPASQKRKKILDISSVTINFCIQMVMSTSIYKILLRGWYFSHNFLVWMTGWLKWVALDNWEFVPQPTW